MKKFILIIVLALSFSLTWGNIALPRAYISEIYIDSIGNWTIELGFFEYLIDIDSMKIETSTASAMITSYTLIGGDGGGINNFDSLAIISNSNLYTPITIYPSADYIKIISYSYDTENIEYIAIGNYPGSFLDCISNNESIAYVEYFQSYALTGSFCIDSSPSIGIGNDTTGALGTFTGVAYYPDGQLMTDVWFYLPDIPNTEIHVGPDGTFAERIMSRRHTFDTIRIYLPPWKYYVVEPVDFCLAPGAVNYQEIRATSIVTAIEEQEDNYEDAVVVAPNPFTDQITFYFRAESFHPTDELDFIILSQNGSVVAQEAITAYQKSYIWQANESISSGIYFYQLFRNKQPIKSGKLIKL